MYTAAFLFIATVLAGAVLTAAAVFSVLRGRPARARRFVLAMGVIAVLYLGGLVLAAALSDPVDIALGGEKYICEIDCHVAYSVVGTDTVRELGAGVRARGVFHVVTVRTRFDGETVSNRRAKGMPLRPGTRRIRLVDAEGREYGVSGEGQKALGEPDPAPHMLTRPLMAGEEFTTRLVFDLPAGAREPRLLIQDTDVTKWVLIGSETLPIHAKAMFRLTPGPGVRDSAS